MKQTIVALVALCILIACNKETPQQTAVRQYIINELQCTECVITHMSPLDSVFTPYNIESSAEYFTNRLQTEIAYHRRTLADSWATRREIAVARDSINLLRHQIDSIKSVTNKLIAAKKPNRLGIVVKLTRNNVPHEFTFVFNNDGETISHLLDDFGKVFMP